MLEQPLSVEDEAKHRARVALERAQDIDQANVRRKALEDSDGLDRVNALKIAKVMLDRRDWSTVGREDLLEMRLALSEEGRAQNAVVALEAQLELRRAEYMRAQEYRAALGKRICDVYGLGTGDSYNAITGAITRQS